MDNPTTRPPLITISTQTEDIDNTGKGRDPIQPELHPQIFPLSNSETIPDYRKHLSQVFGEEFLAEATRQDRTLTPIMKMIKEKDWEALRKSNNISTHCEKTYPNNIRMHALRQQISNTTKPQTICHRRNTPNAPWSSRNAKFRKFNLVPLHTSQPNLESPSMRRMYKTR